MGKVAEIKSKATGASADDFIAGIADEQKRQDSAALMKLMERVTKETPRMWGPSTIGFGQTRYKSPATGREVDWLKMGFSARKANFSLFPFNFQSLAGRLEKLGKHKTGVGCLYINKLADVDMKVLEAMIAETVKSK